MGCSASEGPPTFPVRGVLRVDGRPAEQAQVILHPADGVDFDQRGCRPTGVVDAEGNFVLTTYQPGDGAPAGDYVVTVYWAKNPDALEPSPDRLRGRFLSPDKSKIQVAIREGENDLDPIELSSRS